MRRRLLIRSLTITLVATCATALAPVTAAHATNPCGGPNTGSELVNGQIVNNTDTTLIALKDWNFNTANPIQPPAPVYGNSPARDAVISDRNDPYSYTYCRVLNPYGDRTPWGEDWDGFWAFGGCYWSWHFDNEGPGVMSIDLRPYPGQGAFVRLSAGKAAQLIVDQVACPPVYEPPAPPPPQPWQWYTPKQLRNQANGYCMVVQGGAEGSQAFMHDCDPVYADQLWTLRPANGGGGMELANANSGSCLVTPYWYNNGGVTQTYCDIYPDSKWILLEDGQAKTRLKNVYTGLCLVGSINFSYDVTTAPCSSSLDQYWAQR